MITFLEAVDIMFSFRTVHRDMSLVPGDGHQPMIPLSFGTLNLVSWTGLIYKITNKWWDSVPMYLLIIIRKNIKLIDIKKDRYLFNSIGSVSFSRAPTCIIFGQFQELKGTSAPYTLPNRVGGTLQWDNGPVPLSSNR